VATAQRIVDDLLNLEIDVIIKPGMTARKMPEPAQALLDVIGMYDTYLCQVANSLNPRWEEIGAVPVRVRPSEERPPEAGAASPNRKATPDGRLEYGLRTTSVSDVVSEDTFDALRERAVEAEAVYRHLVGTNSVPEDERGVILTRIYRNCDQIKAMLRRPEAKAVTARGIDRDSSTVEALPLTSDEVVTVRKVWEIGVETVVMQTVVQLDGDIITRVQRGWEGSANKSVHDLHQEAVGNALRHWQFLVQTVAQFLTSALRDFFVR
jgi:hypothetical protein